MGANTMKVKLKKGIKPFVFVKGNKAYRIPKMNIPKNVYKQIKHKVTKIKKKRRKKKRRKEK